MNENELIKILTTKEEWRLLDLVLRHPIYSDQRDELLILEIERRLRIVEIERAIRLMSLLTPEKREICLTAEAERWMQSDNLRLAKAAADLLPDTPRSQLLQQILDRAAVLGYVSTALEIAESLHKPSCCTEIARAVEKAKDGQMNAAIKTAARLVWEWIN